MRRLADMRTATAALLAILSFSTAARAQPVSPTPAPEPAPAAPEPAVVEPAAPAPEPSEETTPPDPPAASVDAAGSPNRPEGMSMGIGVGYSIPAQLLEPNLASVRFRFPSGLTVEPTLVLSTTRSTVEVGPAETETESGEATFAANLRFPLAGRGKIDLVLIGGAGLTYNKQSPDGPDNDTTSATFALSWGLGLDYWPKQSWCLSASATNPLFAFTRTRQEMAPQDQKTTTLTFGAIFDPGVFVTLHMFF